ncbi:MAG: 1,4-alpha-glucan branching protein GlgB [Lachnospiraceae bacterium]|nr:1,4-alpha-glucan branching protein GlgB [Lachnospiraceae bacterium]
MGKTSNIISDMDRYLFGHGTHYEIYKKLGAHPMKRGRQNGVYFSVWAPHAKAVHVTGDFNDWDGSAAPMKPLADSGIFEAFVPKAVVGQLYKYVITTADDRKLYKADPYAFEAELRPGTASRITDLSRHTWGDKNWMLERKKLPITERPLSIYEVHLGSWRRAEDGSFYDYRRCAEELADYVKDMGYTHIELIGIAEYPYDGSWGYQVTGYYAPTSRYGTPEDFMYFIDHMHQKGIGVILDWVPAHFPRDAHGLADFDGTPTYEYADPKKGEHPDWGTKVFDYSKLEVVDFLIANALFWAEAYHVDGLRVDAVASMLYLDYGRPDGQWTPNIYGGKENLEVIEFFRHLNSIMKKRNPDVMMIAEESTAWPMITKEPSSGGLGFTYKWNMGWMHDFLEYVKLDPLFRKGAHDKMTFGLTYSYSENFILVLSHDEVVHLKCSMLSKMPGIYEDKYANLKVAYTYMIGHPGKKLLFMGQEFGQWREWSEERALDWDVLEDTHNADLKNFYRDLLHLYKKYPALHTHDSDWESFEWINCSDASRSIFSFLRKDPAAKGNFLFVCNFTPMARDDYMVGVPRKGRYTLILDNEHGLLPTGQKKVFSAKKAACDGREYSLSFPLPAYGIAIFRFK